MGKEISIGLLGTVLVLALTWFYHYQYQKDYSILGTVNIPSVSSHNINSNINVSSSGSGQVVLSLAEIAKHNGARDCWLIIENKVYNVTNYLYTHPGGAGTIIPLCGQEATQAFLTKGGQGSHSNGAFQGLQYLYIGDVGAQVKQNVINNIQQNTNSLNSLRVGRGEYEND